MSYGASISDMFRRSAEPVDKIHRGSIEGVSLRRLCGSVRRCTSPLVTIAAVFPIACWLLWLRLAHGIGGRNTVL